MDNRENPIPNAMWDLLKKHPYITIFFILFFTILAIGVFPPSSSSDTMKSVLCTIITCQITVISIFFALAIFSAEFASGTTSPYLVRLILTDHSLIKKGVLYSLCVLFELIILMSISDVDSFISISRYSNHFYNTIFLNVIQVYSLFIYICLIISGLILLSILKEYAGFFSDDMVIGKMFSHIKKLRFEKNKIDFEINHYMIFDTLQNYLKSSKSVRFNETFDKIWNHGFNSKFNRDESYDILFFEQIDYLLTVAQKENNYSIIKSIFNKLGETSQIIIKKDAIFLIFSIYKKNYLKLIESNNLSICYDITKSMQNFVTNLNNRSDLDNDDFAEEFMKLFDSSIDYYAKTSKIVSEINSSFKRVS
nr:hypothetical protein [uncultured Methanospirillum sp.]